MSVGSMPKIHWSGWKWKKFSWICWWVRWVSGMLYELEHWIKEKYLFQKWNIYLQQIQHSLKYRHKMRSAIVTFITTTLVLVTKSYIFPMPFIPGFFGSVAQLCPTLCDCMNGSTARPPCPSPTPGVYSNSCPLSRWCCPTISSSVVPFSSCPQSFPASGYFPMSQLFTSGGQSVGVSASNSVLPMNTQDWSLGWTGWISLQFKGLLRNLLQHHSSKASILQRSAFFIVQLSHPYMTIGKTIALTRWTFVDKIMSLLFNMLSTPSKE